MKCPRCGFAEGERVRMISGLTRLDGTQLEVHGKIEIWEFGCHLAVWDDLPTATQLPNPNVEHDNGTSSPMMTLLFIVNGEEIELETPVDEILGAVLWAALEKTKNTGRPDSNWEARRANGVLLDRLAYIKELDLAPRELIFLTLSLGVGG